MTFRLDEKKLLLQLFAETIEPKINKTMQYFLPYLLESKEELIDFIMEAKDAYISEDLYIYFKVEIKEGKDTIDQIIDLYSLFREKGEFKHFEKDGVIYAGVKPPVEMVEAFLHGRYSEMYNISDIMLIFTEETMRGLFHEWNRRQGIGKAKLYYFFLKKTVYTITKNISYYKFVQDEVGINGELDTPPDKSNLIK